MWVFIFLYLIGILLPFFCIPRYIRDTRYQDRHQRITAILIPILFWAFIAVLHYFEGRAINAHVLEHGRLPPWKW